MKNLWVINQPFSQPVFSYELHKNTKTAKYKLCQNIISSLFYINFPKNSVLLLDKRILKKYGIYSRKWNPL